MNLKDLSAAWSAYEQQLMKADGAKDLRRLTKLAEVRANLIAEIEAIGGLVRVANIYWLDGETLEIGERVEYRHGPDEEWRAATVGRYATRLIFDDGRAVLLLDTPEGAEARRIPSEAL
jgi:hypothetical protein